MERNVLYECTYTKEHASRKLNMERVSGAQESKTYHFQIKGVLDKILKATETDDGLVVELAKMSRSTLSKTVFIYAWDIH